MTTIAPQDKQHHLENKLLDLAFEKVGFSAVSAILLAALIVVALWSIIEHERLLAWLGMMTLIQALSFFQARRYMRLRHGVDFAPGKWRGGLIAGGAVAGLCWGSTVFSFPVTPFNPETLLGMFVLPSTPFDPVTVLLMFILAGVTAYASVAMAFVPAFAVVFLACTLLPLSIWLLSFGEHMYVVMGLIALSYLGVMVMLSRRMYSTMCNLIAVSEENNVLRQDQQENNLRMQQFFESAPGFFYTACLSQDGKSSMPFASAGIHELFEVTAGDVEKSMTALFARVNADDIVQFLAAREVSRSHLAPLHIEFRVKHSCKGERWVELNSLPQRDSDGATRWHGFMQDITVRKRMEEALTVTRMQLETVVDAIPDLLWMKDVHGVYLTCNPALAHYFSCDRNDILGKTDCDLMPEAEAVVCLASDNMAQSSSGVNVVEETMVRDDGSAVVLEIRKLALRDADGHLIGILGLGRDISLQRQLEIDLHRSEAEFRSLAENLPVAVIRYDAEQRRCYLNPAAEKMLHGSATELLGNVPGGPMVPATPEMIKHYRGQMEKVLASGGACEFEFVLDALHVAEREYYEVRFTPELGVDGKPGGVLAIWFDITERKRMEKALRDSERMLQEAQRIAHVGSWDVDMLNDRLVWSDEIFRIWEIDKTKFKADFAAFLETVHPEDRERVSRIYNESVVNHSFYEVEHRLLFPDGRVKHILERGEPQYDEQGKPVQFIGTSLDITERKHMEEVLAAREREFRSLAENMPDNVARWDLEGRYLYLNPVHERSLGLSAQDVLGKSLSEIFGEVHLNNGPSGITLAITTGKPVLVERFAMPGENGEIRFHDIQSVPEFDADGRIVSVLGIGRDMTDIYRMQDELAERERDFRSLAENLPDNIARWDVEGRYLYINPTHERLLGVAASEVIGKPIPATHEHVKAAIAQVAASGRSVELVRQTVPVDGEFQTHEVTLVPEFDATGHVVSVLGLGRNMTEYYRMRDAIAAREQELRALAESSPGMMGAFYSRPDGSICMPYVSQKIEELFGLQPQDVLDDALPLLAMNHPNDAQRVADSIAESARTMTIWHEEYRIIHPTRGERWMESNTSPEPHPDGGIIWYGYVHDITERKQAQQQLELLDRAIDMSADTVFMMNEQLRFVYVNETACRALGYSCEELLAMDVCDIDPDTPREVIVKIIKESPLGVPAAVEARHRTKDGRIYPVEISGVQFEEGGARFALTVARDITERKQAELALRASEEQAQSRSNLLNAIVDSSPDVIVFALDTQYRYLSFNRKHKEVMQAIWGREIAAGMSMLEVIGAHPDREAAKRGFDRALSGESFVLEEAYGDELLSRQYWMNYWSPIRAETGDVVGLTCFVMNVTERRRIEEAMRANQEKLSTLFALSPLGIALTDMQGRYVEFNEAFRAICGYPTDELMMLDYWTLTPKKYETQEAEQLESLAKTGRYGPYEKEYRQKNGMLIPIQLNGMLVTGKDGQQYIWSIVEDIRERKKSEAVLKERFQRIAELNQHLEQNARDLEEQAVELEMSKEQLQQTEAWYRSILHSAPDGMLIVDSRGYIMQVNAQLEAMFGYEGGELPGCHIEVLLPQSVRASHVDKRSAFISSGQRDRRMAGAAQDLFGCRKDGSEFPVDVSLSRLPDLDGRVGTICAAVRDVTERQKADVARESALSEALRLAQLRSSFLAQMSHELRTPLNGILGYTQNLLRGEALGEDQRSGLNIIQHSGEHLLTLINGILDHAAIEAGKFELVPGDIELEAFLTTLIGIIRVRAEQKSIAFSCEAGDDLPAIVRGDAQRLRQVLLNLLSNAVKFTDKGQVILRVTYPAPSRLRFEVQDSGVGIAADQLDSIFLPFEQVGETSRRAGGNGLGLAISRKLVDLMGGSIHVESHLGAGSVFSFEIEMVAVESDAAKVNAAVLSERAATRNSPLASLLFAPPAQELDVLHALALRGNMRDIARQATHLSELDSRYGPFAEHLRQLAKGFQTKALLGFIAQYRNAKE